VRFRRVLCGWYVLLDMTFSFSGKLYSSSVPSVKERNVAV
jgi:hypothetical protein